MTDRVIRVIIDPSGSDSGSRRVNRNLVSIDRNTKTATKSLGLLTKAAGAFAGIFGARKIIQASDQFRQIRGQIDLVTDSYDQLNTVQGALIQVAQDTRQPLASTVSLYTRLARTTNFAEAEIAQLTKTINQAVSLSQTAPQSARAALFQLGQGFAAGALRGEELNSVLEQTPELAKAIADGLDVTVGELRALGFEGKLTAETVQRALANVADSVDRDFQNLPLTVGQAVTQFDNAFTVFVGQLDAGVGAGELLADTISGLADFLQNDLLGIIERVGLQIDASFVTPMRAAAEEFSDAIGVIGENGQTVGAVLEDVLSNIPINIATVVKLATVEVASFIEGVRLRFEKLKNVPGLFAENVENEIGEAVSGFERFSNLLTQGPFAGRANVGANPFTPDTEAIDAQKRLNEQIERNKDLRLETIQSILDERDATIETVDIKLKELDARRNVIGELSNERRESEAKAAVDAKAAETLQDLIDKLEMQTEVLRLQNTLGDGAAAAIQRYRIEMQLAAVEGGALEETVRAANEALIEQQRIAADNKLLQSDTDFIDSLTKELELLKLGNEQRKIEENLRRLSVLATEDQIEQVRSLSEEIAQQEAALDAQSDFLKRFRESAFDTVSGTLANALTDGFDEVPRKFADLLQQLAAEALTAEIFKILTGFFTTGAGGGIGGFFGGLFGERATGGTFNAGQPFIAGEGGPGARPELVLPTTSGRVIPANQTANLLGGGQPNVDLTIVNADDARQQIDALQTNAGSEAVMNIIQRNASKLKRILR